MELYSSSENAFSVGWMDGHAAQWTRFETLLSCLPLESGDSLLDLGCGVGHLIDFAVERGRGDLQEVYTGCDPHALAIDKARERHPRHSFIVGDIFSAELQGSIDWVIMSGIFNIGVSEAEMFRSVVEACSRATKGVAFNALLAPYEHDEYEAYDPEAVTAQLQAQGYSSRVLQGYGVAGEFTVRVQPNGL
jgi:SAM-dependent methyltransferase